MTHPTDSEKLARCKAVAEELQRLNPTLRFLYSPSSVVCEHGAGKLMLCSSWTIMGNFIPETFRLDVTEYFNRAEAFAA